MFLISLFLAALMGYAIQRGATCTVAAMDEIMRERRAHRLMAMLEASIWVAGSFLLAQAFGFAIALPMGHATSALAIGGGLLLGAGAYVNQACVFGAIARLGSGEWAYLFTPLGFLSGAWLIAVWMPAVTHASIASPLMAFPLSLALVAAVFMVVRIVPAIVAVLRAHPSSTTAVRKELGGRLWRPEAATAVIGVTFFFLLVIEGAWAYTDVLNEAAQGKWQNIAPRAGLLLALLAGATLGGLDGRTLAQGHAQLALDCALLRRRRIDGRGQRHYSRQQRRTHPARHAPVVCTCVDRVPCDGRGHRRVDAIAPCAFHNVEMKLQHWSGVQAFITPNAAPVIDF